MIAGTKGKIARLLPQPVLQTAFDLLNGRTAVQRSVAGQLDKLRTRTARAGLDAAAYGPVRTRKGTVVAELVERFSATEAAQANAALAAEAAESAGVPYRLEPGPPGRGLQLIAPAEALGLIERELRRLAVNRPIYAAGSDADPPGLLHAIPEAPHPLEVFEYRSADGLVLAGADLACRIRPDGDEPLAMMDEVTDPVDIVYTWVDGDDPLWARQRAAAWSRIHPGAVNPYAANAERYRSHDELRYSLRSVDYFAPWVNKVYLVTAGQVPAWLDVRNPRMTVVDHGEIFPPEALPTFNSHAIEARLHRIPGLSEHFLYLNDDVFLGRPVGPELFFHGNGLAKFFPSEQRIPAGPATAADLPVDSAAKRNRGLLEEKFGRSVSLKFKHAAHAQRISTLQRIEQDFAAEHARTTYSRFRSPDDISIPSSLAHYYGYGIGTAVPAPINYRFCDISAPSAPAKLLRLLGDRNADVFCLNETGPGGVGRDRQDVMLGNFLEAYFPVPSSFELGEE